MGKSPIECVCAVLASPRTSLVARNILSAMPPPIPTPILRFIHIDNLPVLLHRQALHAPNHTPDDGLAYRTIHDLEVQEKRQSRNLQCGPGGVIHDYVSFYFGPLSPMMLRLHTGRVEGYREGQEPLVYIVSDAQAVEQAGLRFVFGDGHGLAAFTQWFDDLAALPRVDWEMVHQKYWKDDPMGDNDRQRRKQAEFLVHQAMPWGLIREIVVINQAMKARVEVVFHEFPEVYAPPVRVRQSWYY